VEDHYATLQVRASASAEEIEQAYRRLVRLHHPDLLQGASPDARRHAEDLLKRINRAHGVIGDRERRRDYDRQRLNRRTPVTAPERRSTPSAAPAFTPRDTAERTTHWGGGGPIDIEWETPLERAPRQTTELFSLGRLLRYAAAIILFATLLAIIWRPGLGRPVVAPPPTPTAPIVIVTPPPAPGPTLVPAVGTPLP
jgi:curved DNA-binding protein CbpA